MMDGSDRRLARWPHARLVCALALLWQSVSAHGNDQPPLQLPWMPLESARSLWTPLTRQTRDSLTRSIAPNASTTARPLRVLELVTGERLFVEWLSADRECVEFRWRGRNRLRVPWTDVASVSIPSGVIDVLDESFEDSALGEETSLAHSGRFSRRCDASLPPWRWTSASPVVAGRLQWCQRVESVEATRGRAEIFVEFDNPPARLSISSEAEGPRPLGLFSVQPPNIWSTEFRQPLRLRAGWQIVSVDWGNGEWRVLVGDAVLATGRGPIGALSAIEIGPVSESAVLWIDDVRLQRRNAAQAIAPALDESLDSLMLTSGDVLFGEVEGTDASGWRLRGPRQTVSVPWTEWTGLRRRTAAAESASSFVHGSLRRVETSPVQWPRGLSGDVLIAAANPERGELTEWDHPLLGRLVLSVAEIDTQSLLHRGDFCWLEPRRVHLGDELRPEFTHSRPSGHSLSGTFTLHTRPRGACYISLEAAELEPSGPDTPPTEPFLTALRGGALRTELFVNGHLVSDWNRLLSWRPRVSHPERLRLEVPSSMLRVGENRWEVRQQPLKPGDDRYDDCELGRMALEISH